MAYIENPFNENDYALCISDDFPVVHSTADKAEIGTYPKSHPQKGKVYLINEILGEYLRFNEFDCHDENSPNYGWNWWNHTQFRPIAEEEEDFHNEEYAKSVSKWFYTEIVNRI